MPAPTEPTRRNAHFEAQLRDRLAGFEVKAHTGSAERRAAVAVAVIDEGGGAGLEGFPVHVRSSDRAALLLTRRAATLRNHAGQWSFPGGRIDGDESPEQAALRELEEEVGLSVHPACVLGRLDDFVTRSGYVITPVVIWAGPGIGLVRNPAEVESLHRIPVDEFLRDDAPMLESLEGSEHPVLRMPIGPSWIAAPTAAVLYQFRELCLLGRATRVAHFEQPLFAWR